MKQLLRYYFHVSVRFSFLQSPSLLAIRLYRGWQFVQTGWGKMHHTAKITGYFMSRDLFEASCL
jgi:putative oxidoreductase